jgi:Mg2+ and Co2+ transporter CorA
MLIDAFHIIASEWMVVEDYLNRELMTVEFRLETSDLSFRDLESLMKGLHTVRRRCTCYQELINNARHFCEARGQPYWPRTTTSSIAEADAALLAKDFEKLAEKMQRIVLRTRKDIKLLIGLVAISQGNVGLQRNLGVERLTVFAALFLPFTTVATVLALPGEFAPGRGRFWVLWAVALPIFVFVCFALGEDFRGEVLKHVQSS